jgi:hypothetical protein
MTSALEIATHRRSTGKLFRVQGELIGNLYMVGSEVKLIPQPKIVDVSKRGLGLITKFMLNPGQRITLQVSDNISISLEVVHCSNHLGIPGLYRCGLFIRSNVESIDQILQKLELVPLEEVPKLY